MTRAEKAIRNKNMCDYKAQGHTMQEVADKFGMTKGSAQKICKGIAPQKPVVVPVNKGIIKNDSEVSKFISERMPEFEYAGQCWLCGGRCDYSDKEIRDNGVTVVGYNYPSIDHVIPLAEGGLHSWDNVRLAHWRCNSLKRDKIITT